MAKQVFPIFSSGHRQLSEKISVQCIDEQVGYFFGLHPLYNHRKDDLASFKLVTSLLYHNHYCTQVQIIDFFQVSPRGVKRAYKLFFDDGPASFFQQPKKGNHTAKIFTPELIELVQNKLDKGISKKEIVETLGIKIDTFNKAIRSGRLVQKKSP